MVDGITLLFRQPLNVCPVYQTISQRTGRWRPKHSKDSAACPFESLPETLISDYSCPSSFCLAGPLCTALCSHFAPRSLGTRQRIF